MKMIKYSICALMLIFVVSACNSQSKAANQTNSSQVFQTKLRADGTAFYAMNSKTGQLSFMLDYGEKRGVWRQFGPTIQPNVGNPMGFGVVERPGATSFYAMDSQTGQIYYTNDDNSGESTWQKYGNTIRSNGLSPLQLSVQGRFGGNSFFALDTYSGQMYYMNDFEEGAGVWKKYGDNLK